MMSQVVAANARPLQEDILPDRSVALTEVEEKSILKNAGGNFYLSQFLRLNKAHESATHKLSSSTASTKPQLVQKIESIDILIEEVRTQFEGFSNLEDLQEVYSAIHALRDGIAGKSMLDHIVSAINDSSICFPSSMHKVDLALRMVGGFHAMPSDVYETTKRIFGKVPPADVGVYLNLDLSSQDDLMKAAQLLNAWSPIHRSTFVSMDRLNHPSVQVEILNQACILSGLPVIFRVEKEKIFSHNEDISFVEQPKVELVRQFGEVSGYAQLRFVFEYDDEQYVIRWHPPTNKGLLPCLRISRCFPEQADIMCSELINPSSQLHAHLKCLHDRSAWNLNGIYFCDTTQRFWARYENQSSLENQRGIYWMPLLYSVSSGGDGSSRFSVRHATHIPFLPDGLIFPEISPPL